VLDSVILGALPYPDPSKLVFVLALGRSLEALLFQVRARDPLTLALASCMVLAISPVAIWLPLRRAPRVDCTVALRAE
jgi:hypothetical protein